jgi:hypothetical protein
MTQTRSQTQQRDSDGEQAGELVQKREQSQQRLMTQEPAEEGAAVRTKNQIRKSFNTRMNSSRMGGGAGRR